MSYSGAGIYGIYNVMENKIYIGASYNIASRFSQHKYCFSVKSKANPMYDKPVEDFVFLVLQKMSNEEFQKYGGIVEHLFIIQAQYKWMGIYNQNKLNTDATFEVLSAIKAESKLYSAIREELKVRPWTIRYMNEKSRKKLLENRTA